MACSLSTLQQSNRLPCQKVVLLISVLGPKHLGQGSSSRAAQSDNLHVHRQHHRYHKHLVLLLLSAPSGGPSLT
jgi:hypothetical protein